MKPGMYVHLPVQRDGEKPEKREQQLKISPVGNEKHEEGEHHHSHTPEVLVKESSKFALFRGKHLAQKDVRSESEALKMNNILKLFSRVGFRFSNLTF